MEKRIQLKKSTQHKNSITETLSRSNKPIYSSMSEIAILEQMIQTEQDRMGQLDLSLMADKNG